MVPKINGLGRSFVGVAAYCLHRAPEPDDRSPETSEREQGRIRCEARAKNNARRATPPGGEERVDMTVWRRAEAQLWENAEDRRWLEFWRLESRARKEWAELHKRQVREAYRSGLRDSERRERPTLPDLVDRDVERAARETKERERCRSITRIPPRPRGL